MQRRTSADTASRPRAIAAKTASPRDEGDSGARGRDATPEAPRDAPVNAAKGSERSDPEARIPVPSGLSSGSTSSPREEGGERGQRNDDERSCRCCDGIGSDARVSVPDGDATPRNERSGDGARPLRARPRHIIFSAGRTRFTTAVHGPCNALVACDQR